MRLLSSSIVSDGSPNRAEWSLLSKGIPIPLIEDSIDVADVNCYWNQNSLRNLVGNRYSSLMRADIEKCPNTSFFVHFDIRFCSPQYDNLTSWMQRMDNRGFLSTRYRYTRTSLCEVNPLSSEPCFSKLKVEGKGSNVSALEVFSRFYEFAMSFLI